MSSEIVGACLSIHDLFMSKLQAATLLASLQVT